MYNSNRNAGECGLNDIIQKIVEGADRYILVRSEEIWGIAVLSLVTTVAYYGLGWAMRLFGKLFYLVLVGVLVYLVWMAYAGKL